MGVVVSHGRLTPHGGGSINDGSVHERLSVGCSHGQVLKTAPRRTTEATQALADALALDAGTAQTLLAAPWNASLHLLGLIERLQQMQLQALHGAGRTLRSARSSPRPAGTAGWSVVPLLSEVRGVWCVACAIWGEIVRDVRQRMPPGAWALWARPAARSAWRSPRSWRPDNGLLRRHEHRRRRPRDSVIRLLRRLKRSDYLGMLLMNFWISGAVNARKVCVRTLPSCPLASSAVIAASSLPSLMTTAS